MELNGVPVSPTISDREFVEQLMSLSRPVVLGFTRQGKDFVSAAREEEEANRAAGSGAPATPEGYMVGGLSMDEVRTRTIYTYIYILEHSSGLAVVLFFRTSHVLHPFLCSY